MRFALLLASLCVGLIPLQRETESGDFPEPISDVILVKIDDEAITPVTADFFRRALQAAEEKGATLVVLALDTPGGLMDATQQIVRDILGSSVPVAVYVSPQGARAASAGVFITLAGHIAAMAPGTHIGAAHPVSIGGIPGTAPSDTTADSSVMSEKVVNDAVAWARSLAEMRGRNADWAESAVTKSASITATIAVEENVVDFIAENIPELLQEVDSVAVELQTGQTVIRTSAARVHEISMWWGERLLAALSNPNIAFLLLILGFYGVLFEFYSPGWGVAGTVGAICILLAFFGLSFMPINYVGLALLLVGLGLFVAEAFVTSFGLLSLGGVICVVLGGLMLIDSPSGLLRISGYVVIPVAGATAVITLFLALTVVRSHRRKPLMGIDQLIGVDAIATTDFVETQAGYVGTVQVRGELWQAESRIAVQKDQQIRVSRRNGLVLDVSPFNGNG
jgi:membrane-bound serine protease (ClpP class)